MGIHEEAIKLSILSCQEHIASKYAMGLYGNTMVCPLYAFTVAQGRSRSAAVVFMNLVIKRGLPVLAAFLLLTARRPSLVPMKRSLWRWLRRRDKMAASAPKDSVDGTPNSLSSVPEDLQVSHRAFVLEFDTCKQVRRCPWARLVPSGTPHSRLHANLQPHTTRLIPSSRCPPQPNIRPSGLRRPLKYGQ